MHEAGALCYAAHHSHPPKFVHMNAAVRHLRLLVLPLVTRENLHAKDRECEGIYQAEVPASLDNPEAAASVVDSFHRSVSPCRPDDFVYQVWDGERQLPVTDIPSSHFVSLQKEPSRLRGS